MNKYLTKISSDLEIAIQSKKEEDKAISDYTQRLKEVRSPVLRKALEHARSEEKDHSKELSEAARKARG